MTMQKDLAEVVSQLSRPDVPAVRSNHKAAEFVESHHAEIAQNAEAARRLSALEQAMGEVEKDNAPKYSATALVWIRQRADEIMRSE